MPLAVVVFVWVQVVMAANDRYNEDRHCRARHGVVAVRVPAGDVVYARAHGWPGVLVRADAVGFAPAYDHSVVGRRVTRLARGWCSWQRLRLVAR